MLISDHIFTKDLHHKVYFQNKYDILINSIFIKILLSDLIYSYVYIIYIYYTGSCFFSSSSSSSLA